jgi:hypothetical protein
MLKPCRALHLAACAALIVLAAQAAAAAMGDGGGMGIEDTGMLKPATASSSYLLLNGGGHIGLNSDGAILCNAC